MPFPQPFVKVVASGSMRDSDEIWTCSWSLADPNEGNDAEQPGPIVVGDIADAVRGWFIAPANGISALCNLEQVKVNLVDVNGRYADESNTYSTEFDPAPQGPKSGAPWPNQCTVCITLRSAKRRGPGAYGRFYPPMPIATMGTDGRMGLQDATDRADGAAELVAQLNATAGGVLKVVNASQVGAGSFSLVTKVRVGRVPDTQQRRRNDLDEDYQDRPVRQGNELP
uniref:Uncharacterized protein n=1 Tax=uncultured prokaryote TaxID=198431 RepID=A0A0H5Q566_9ZZZZ|nr:hypothetical protein [uncultured prokaryote]